MKIVLLRHGKPEFDFMYNQRVALNQMHYLQQDYDQAPLVDSSRPSAATIELARSASFVVCSDLPRSLESARRLQLQRVNEVSPLFRESVVPILPLSYPRMKVKNWVVVLRIMWLLGYAGKGESIGALRQRAQRCASSLVDWAAQHETVLFVGHGILNHYIARALLKQRWAGPGSPDRNHWGTTEYVFTDS